MTRTSAATPPPPSLLLLCCFLLFSTSAAWRHALLIAESLQGNNWHHAHVCAHAVFHRAHVRAHGDEAHAHLGADDNRELRHRRFDTCDSRRCHHDADFATAHPTFWVETP